MKGPRSSSREPDSAAREDVPTVATSITGSIGAVHMLGNAVTEVR